MVFFSSRSNLPMSKLDQIYHHLDLIIGTLLEMKRSCKSYYSGLTNFDNRAVQLINLRKYSVQTFITLIYDLVDGFMLILVILGQLHP